MRICAQISSSSVTKRTWSNYDYIQCKRRSCLGVERAKKSVKVYGRLRTEYAAKSASAAGDVIPWRWKEVEDDKEDAGDEADDEDADGEDAGDEAWTTV